MRQIGLFHARHSRRPVRPRAARSDRVGAAQHASAAAQAVLPGARGGEGGAVSPSCSTAVRSRRRPAARWPRRRARSAQAIAAEWDAQGERIDPAAMPLTRLANYDHRRRRRQPRRRSPRRSRNISAPISSAIAPSTPEGLVARAGAALGPDPRLGARDARRALRAERGRGVRRAAGEHAIAAARAAIPSDPWRLGARQRRSPRSPARR